MKLSDCVLEKELPGRECKNFNNFKLIGQGSSGANVKLKFGSSW